MELFIAEKPSVGKAIAAAIGATESKNGYMEGHGFMVTWCLGHLVELAMPEDYNKEFATWRYKDLPIIPDKWKYNVSADGAKQFNIVCSLMNDDKVNGIICATDAGREGELIFRLVYEKAGCRKPVRRLWISSMEESAIREGFHTMKNESAYDNLYQAALCRAQADWLIGMNATRLYSLLYGPTLPIGRVMTPTLAMLSEREDAIEHFEPETFYTVKLDLGNGLIGHSERIHDLSEARSLTEACNRDSAVVRQVEHKEKKENPPLLYDLTTLQRDANRIFGYTAQQTLEYAQALYEKKLLTYPRTDSRLVFGRALIKAFPYANHEQVLWLRISKHLWQDYQREIVDIFKLLISCLPCAYACMDYAPLVPEFISAGNLLPPTEGSVNPDPESVIPGIYWFQYLSDRMLTDKTICALQAAGFAVVEKSTCPGGNGYIIQLTDKVDTVCASICNRFYQAAAYQYQYHNNLVIARRFRPHAEALIHFDESGERWTAEKIFHVVQPLLITFLERNGLDASGVILMNRTDGTTEELHLLTWHDASEITANAWRNAATVHFIICTDRITPVITLDAVLDRSPGWGSPMIKQEQTLRIAINKRLWSKHEIDFAKMIREIIEQTSCTYACVDQATATPCSIYHGNLRIIANHPEKYDPERFVPGIYWAQYLSDKMLDEKCVRKIIAEPFAIAERLPHQGGAGYYVQLTEKLESNSAAIRHRFYQSVLERTYQVDNKQAGCFRK